jgi:hypothetical protein
MWRCEGLALLDSDGCTGTDNAGTGQGKEHGGGVAHNLTPDEDYFLNGSNMRHET